MPQPEIGFVRYLADLPDPRSTRTRCHRLDDILVITLCAVSCGADSSEEIERFGKAREQWLKTFLTLPNGIPSHDTFNRVLAALDREKFAACFARWMTGLCEATGLKAIAIDGKVCRAAPGDTFSGCLHLVNAWAVENNLFLGSVAVADGGHETTAIPEFLKVLDLTGALVTIDAAGGQKATVRQIREPGGLPDRGEGEPAGVAVGRPRGLRPGVRGGVRGRPVRVRRACRFGKSRAKNKGRSASGMPSRFMLMLTPASSRNASTSATVTAWCWLPIVNTSGNVP
jgi:predicted transposase YbfD/YdcC